MPDGPAGTELVEVIKRRIDVLEECERNHPDKRELVEELPQSRSTINRALQELETLGLVDYADGGYTTATAGELAADAYRTLLDQLDAIAEAQPLLEALPDDLAIEPAVLTDARIELAEPPAPSQVIEPLVDLFDEANRLRGLAASELQPELGEAIHERVLAGNLDVEYVLSPELADFVSSERGEMVAQARSTGRAELFVHPAVPANLCIADGPDGSTVTLGATRGNGAILGVIVNDDPTAVRWAEARYRRYRDEAVPFGER